MSTRTTQDEEHWYKCGRCGLEQYALKSEELPNPCVDCGYAHKDRDQYDVPSEIKLDLTKY